MTNTLHETAKHELAHAIVDAVIIADRYPAKYKSAVLHISVDAPNVGECALSVPDVDYKQLKHFASISALGPILLKSNWQELTSAHSSKLKQAGLSERDMELVIVTTARQPEIDRYLAAAHHVKSDMQFNKLASAIIQPEFSAFDGQVTLDLVVPFSKAIAGLRIADAYYASTSSDPKREASYA